jgi:uncharacterized protein YacL
MTYKNGFGWGIVVGLVVTLFATGKVIVHQFSYESQSVSVFVLLLVFLFGNAITFYNARQRHCLFSPSVDGFITGVGFMEAIAMFILYGFRL